ncbi:amino acid permease [Methanoregula formicica]|uniref:Amino acid transporter n=1 Tax=Methanoregula formicica (strain DSM 22288 / NBRC 105244 / SMSP) TaxID=593750 RepID=L0HEY0_METFS|nr:amino acid permease [Methanoregula formicica]AGB03277.1 amino acid transporter [Methanoregula formicica SMSP]
MDIPSLRARFASISETKPISKLMECTRGPGGLKKVLSPLELTLLGIGAIIGTGIFVITGVVAANYSGPALVLSFIISGIACAFAALCYAEFAAMVPVAGSAYTYGYASLGEIWAWIIGWDLILEYSVSIAAVAVGWSGYMENILSSAGIALPAALAGPPGTDGGILNLPAILIILVITGLLVLGVKESARVNTAVVIIKISVILLFLFLAFSHINPANWSPFMPFGWGGVITGAAIVFFAYIGFDAVSTAAEEVKDPQRNVPIGIIGSLLIATVLYLAVSVVLTGIVPYYQFAGTSAPVAFALGEIGISWGSALVAVGAICGITSVLIVLMYGQTRIFFAMSRDGLLPGMFRNLHPVYRTPVRATLLVGIATSLIAGFLPLQAIAELVNIGTLAAFIIVSVGIIVLRRTRPEIDRPFRCPLVPLIPVLCIIFCSVLIIMLPLVTHLRFVLWLAIGLIMYFAYGTSHSRLHDDTAGMECWDAGSSGKP